MNTLTLFPVEWVDVKEVVQEIVDNEAWNFSKMHEEYILLLQRHILPNSVTFVMFKEAILNYDFSKLERSGMQISYLKYCIPKWYDRIFKREFEPERTTNFKMLNTIKNIACDSIHCTLRQCSSIHTPKRLL